MKSPLLSQAQGFIRQYRLEIDKDQFFLVDPAVIRRLIAAAGVKKSDRVLEVGPGLGFLTRSLAE
ncbi:hypothetical protein M1523_03930 [Patescibacteria group bacterium]|nr:hypothetical protein [Patescibacteria group bacterium]MCL5091843.1 hypothetical protein [Patescibacteria group bacterium]